MNDYIKRQDAINALAGMPDYRRMNIWAVAEVIRNIRPTQIDHAIPCVKCAYYQRCNIGGFSDLAFNYCEKGIPIKDPARFYCGFAKEA